MIFESVRNIIGDVNVHGGSPPPPTAVLPAPVAAVIATRSTRSSGVLPETSLEPVKLQRAKVDLKCITMDYWRKNVSDVNLAASWSQKRLMDMCKVLEALKTLCSGLEPVRTLYFAYFRFFTKCLSLT